MMMMMMALFVKAGDDAKIRMWLVPEGGLTETLTEPECVLQGEWKELRKGLIITCTTQFGTFNSYLIGPFPGHTEKIYSIKFHPHASGLLASSSYDLTVRLWDLQSEKEVKKLKGHEDQVCVCVRVCVCMCVCVCAYVCVNF